MSERERYQNEIAQELDLELQKNTKNEKGIIIKTQVLRDIKFDENGKMVYRDFAAPVHAPDCIEQFQESKVLIEYLVSKLVDTKLELYSQKQKTEGLKTELTKAKEAINGVLEGSNSV